MVALPIAPPANDRDRLRPFRDSAICAGALVAAVLLRWLLDPVMGDSLPLVTLFGAVAVAVWVGGWMPAAAVSLAGYAACSYLFIPPRGTVTFVSTQVIVGFLAYFFTCALIIAIGEAMHRARRRAAERSEVLRITLGSIGDAVITTDTAGRVTYVNPVAEKLTGWTTAEALGQPLESVFRIVDEESGRPLESPALRALRENTAVGFTNHTLLLDKAGRPLAIDDSAAPIRDESGRTSGSVLIFRDVARRRRGELEETERLLAARTLAAIVETSDDAIISKSLDGTIRSWNAAAERLFGYSAAEAIGRHISLVIPPDRATEEDDIVATLKAGRRVDHFETERMRRDGTRVHVSLSISPLKDDDGTIVGASKIARDVTDRRRLEDDLRKAAADLAEVDRRKDEFLATLSHELRNPLAPMRNMLQVLRRASGDESTREHALDILERQLGHLVRLVDDLLDLNRITHNRIELRLGRVDLAEVIQQAVRVSEPFAVAGGVTLATELPAAPLAVRGDGVRLAQVFGNLLNNACKYTPPGGAVRVVARGEGGSAVITVKDDGAGIPAEHLENIFEMFTQLDRSLERSQGGLGIGLTLVKRLVEMHGGTVEARSAGEGLGSVFEVRLPLAAAGEPPAATATDPLAVAPRTILIVDDNQDAADSLALLLELRGHRTFQAADGAEALAAAERERPDVILLDIGLPIVNGYEVCRRIRDQSWGTLTVIIALTGWGQDDDRRRSREAGFDSHLVKPVDFTELLALLAATQTASS
jgi:PAS domain S-box-containing protein